MSRIVRGLVVASAILATGCAHRAQAPLDPFAVTPPSAEAGASAADTDDGWPRTLTSGDNQVTVYQPQVESWEGNRLQARAAVSVQTAASRRPVYGVAWFSARPEVDKENRLVTLEDIQLTRTSFPSEPQRADEYAALIREQIAKGAQQIALDRLTASLTVTRAESKQATADVKNDPPRIIFSTSPALLVLIDGQPVLRPVAGTTLLRIVNTRALMLLDQASGTYYFFLGDRWMQATAPTGPWTPVQGVPPSLDTAKQAAAQAKLVDLLDTPGSPLMTDLQRGVVPTIYVSTTPTELIQTAGQPQLEPISGTRLLAVTNSASDIFLDEADQQYYVLLSGRWYRGPSLESGPWAFVSAKTLPPDFARIPENHPKGTVLASVATTPQAKEARIANGIPQTATVRRDQAKLTVRYDGAPDWAPVCGTALAYARNSATPVIRVDSNTYYAVDGGVWFTAGSPAGPWTVATSVPAVIYTIQPCSPIYYVTHVYVYGSTPDAVYTGYTPGYLNSYTSTDGVVVFGTGYVYPAWVGAEWVGWPVTFGFDVGWGPWFGWGFGWGFGVFAGPLFHPWWGPVGWGWGHRDLVVHDFHHWNVYRRAWGRDVVVNRWDRHELANRRMLPFRSELGRNQLYAGRDGSVYRHTPGGWERFEGGEWRSAPHGFDGETELGHESAARGIGASHWSGFRAGGGFHEGGFHGGGFHGRFHAGR